MDGWGLGSEAGCLNDDGVSSYSIELLTGWDSKRSENSQTEVGSAVTRTEVSHMLAVKETGCLAALKTGWLV